MSSHSFLTYCIVCHNPLTHKQTSVEDTQNRVLEGKIPFNRVAHNSCSIIMRKLHKAIDGQESIQKFAQRCIVYDLTPNDKALYMELAIKNL